MVGVASERRKGDGCRTSQCAPMARRRKRRPLKSRGPARVKKRTRAKRKGARGQHAELAGLALAAAGIFLGTLLYLGWEGGYVGGRVTEGLDALVGAAA